MSKVLDRKSFGETARSHVFFIVVVWGGQYFAEINNDLLAYLKVLNPLHRRRGLPVGNPRIPKELSRRQDLLSDAQILS
jgi:hypothetical protein